MYIAMNRFKVNLDKGDAFEEVWKSRDSQLNQSPGFLGFHLLRGPEGEDHVLYSSHTLWASEADFHAWTHSESFKKAHRNAGGHSDLYLEHPKFEGFTVVQTIESEDTELA